MKIDTTAPILSFTKGDDGAFLPMKKRNVTDQFGRVTGPDPASEDFLVRDAVSEAVMGDKENEREKEAASASLRRFRLGNLFADNDLLEVAERGGDLKQEDIEYILGRSPRLGPLIHGRLHAVLRPSIDDPEAGGSDDDDDPGADE